LLSFTNFYVCLVYSYFTPRQTEIYRVFEHSSLIRVLMIFLSTSLGETRRQEATQSGRFGFG